MSMLERLRKQSEGEFVTAALYARFSSDNQRQESIDAQVRAIKEFAKANGILIVAEYVDKAKSATTDDRPAFQKMIKESSKGDFQVIIVHKLDRFARNRNDSIAYRMKLQRNKVALLSVLEPFDEDRPETILLQSVIEGMNEFYSRNLAREVRKGLKENALHCKHTGGSPPLGYNVDKETRLLVINEQEAVSVRMIFQMALDGHGYSDIIRRMNENGFRTKKGRPFGKNSIYEILHNPKYKGTYVYNRKSAADPYSKKRNSHSENSPEDIICIEGGVPSIVAEEVFDQVQTLLKRRRHSYRGIKKNQEQYLLTGKMVCGVCGCSYVGNRKKSSGNRAPCITYRCNRQWRQTNVVCKNREVNRDYIETFVLEQIEKSIFNSRMSELVLARFADFLREKGAEVNQKLKRLEEKVKEIEGKLVNLSDVLADGVVRQQRSIILEKMEKLEDEKIALQSYIMQERSALEVDIPDKEELEKYFREAQVLFRERRLEGMKKLVDLYVEKIIVHESEVEVILNLVPFAFKQDFAEQTHTIERLELMGREKYFKKRRNILLKNELT